MTLSPENPFDEHEWEAEFHWHPMFRLHYSHPWKDPMDYTEYWNLQRSTTSGYGLPEVWG